MLQQLRARVRPRDVIAVVALIGVFALLALGRITWQQGSAVVLLVLGAYGVSRRVGE